MLARNHWQFSEERKRFMQWKIHALIKELVWQVRLLLNISKASNSNKFTIGEDIEDIDGKMCVVCPGHGYNFNLKTGKCTNFPEYQQKTFKCKVLEEDVWVLV